MDTPFLPRVACPSMLSFLICVFALRCTLDSNHAIFWTHMLLVLIRFKTLERGYKEGDVKPAIPRGVTTRNSMRNLFPRVIRQPY
ncbi:hypothetical protein B0F90DRAFT_1751640 [Multifurca ochricompacta]|uniref:Secreted protein n=1 Tax=Multifurca ochricompacta TaxID=376703 RepID=A0AAD4LZ73_9AGAM|nr:hypothetical protein B0F90DRAFT_1751640 [Multifurca ochricompacta]